MADDALNDPRSVAHLEELELLASAFVVQPASELDRFADVISKLSDVHRSHPCEILQG